MAEKLIAWFSEIGKEDTLMVGGKGANLGEMAGIGMPVPPGFVVTAEAYRHFLAENKLSERIDKVLSGLNVDDPVALSEASRAIKKMIETAPVPEDLATKIIGDYLELSRRQRAGGSRLSRLVGAIRQGQVVVAVRSSATSEDSKTASFAGQNETFLNIWGEANLVEAVRRCWASLFDGRSIFYRVQNHFDHKGSYIAVVVQAMVPSEISGILFSIDPVTNNKNRIVIEAVWGLGEYAVGGKVTPDHYEVDKSTLMVVEKRLAEQKVMLVRDERGNTKEVRVPKSKVAKLKLTDQQIKRLALLAYDLERHYYFPQDSEFAVSGGQIYLVQTRPITTVQNQELGIRNPESQRAEKEEMAKMEEVLSGAPASPGVTSGPVKVLKSASEIGRVLPGDVLVAPQTNPDYVPAMKKAAAIVTDSGGRTSHAAIVSRELGIPAVVGTEKATRKLRDGMVVTVDGGAGKVFRGGLRIKSVTQLPSNSVTYGKKRTEKMSEEKILKTATKVYVNLAETDLAKQVAARDCDGVGLLRAEFMLAGIGMHPKEAIARGKKSEFTEKLADSITLFAQAFYPRPVVYRTTDFKTNEYRSLKGGEKYEPQEENPMIGFRGAYRYTVQPGAFLMELEAIKRVREKNDLKNLWVMIPFCRTVAELEKVKDLLEKAGLRRSPSFKLWMMCEIPSNVILLDKFIEVGLDGISIGSNDLTMLMLGVDRDNENVASEYNEMNEAMLLSFEKVVRTCNRYGVTCSMCGQAPSDYPELTERLVELGITSVSVNPDVIEKTREIVYRAEAKMVAKRGRK